MTIADKIRNLSGPVCILGGSGFIGANLFRLLSCYRDDVYGTTRNADAWRLQGCDTAKIYVGGFDANSCAIKSPTMHKTFFNCMAYGAYSWQSESKRIYETNFELTRRIAEDLLDQDIAAYVHAGSSSEYGAHSAGPFEDDPLTPNSDYAVSKAAASQYLFYVGTQKRFPCVNLRLYSVYGPWEDKGRLIPQVVEHGLRGEFPQFVDPNITRDFVYVDDVCEAFVDAALALQLPEQRHIRGQAFNIGTGACTSIGRVASIAKRVFGIPGEPTFTMPSRGWDTANAWYANPSRAAAYLGWQYKTDFEAGLRLTAGVKQDGND